MMRRVALTLAAIAALPAGGSAQLEWDKPKTDKPLPNPSRLRIGRDQASPIVAGDYLLATNMEGLLVCYDAKSGKELWKDRITANKITAAPVSAEGRVYFLDESGETAVIEPGPAFKLLVRNSLNPGAGEIFRATPTPSSGQFLLRSDRVLYCVAGEKQ